MIVLIEDNPIHARLVQEYLTRARADNPVVHFEDGREAIEFLLACEGQRALVLLDLQMPAWDGHEVLRTIKHDAKLRRVPVIVLTNTRDDAEALRCYEAGCNLYLTKPQDRKEWDATIRKLGDIISAMEVPR